MPHPRGKRSEEAVERREAKREEKVNHTRRDYLLAETVCIHSYNRIVTFYSAKTGYASKEKVTVEAGEITLDSRGRGSYDINPPGGEI